MSVSLRTDTIDCIHGASVCLECLLTRCHALQFGCSKLTQDLVDRMEKLTGRPAHPLLRRGVFYAHRDLEELLNAYEKGEPFYLYTGRVRAAAVFILANKAFRSM